MGAAPRPWGLAGALEHDSVREGGEKREEAGNRFPTSPPHGDDMWRRGHDGRRRPAMMALVEVLGGTGSEEGSRRARA